MSTTYLYLGLKFASPRLVLIIWVCFTVSGRGKKRQGVRSYLVAEGDTVGRIILSGPVPVIKFPEPRHPLTAPQLTTLLFSGQLKLWGRPVQRQLGGLLVLLGLGGLGSCLMRRIW